MADVYYCTSWSVIVALWMALPLVVTFVSGAREYHLPLQLAGVPVVLSLSSLFLDIYPSHGYS